jgi:hypothetical protein
MDEGETCVTDKLQSGSSLPKILQLEIKTRWQARAEKMGDRRKPLNVSTDKLSNFRFVNVVNFSFPNRPAAAESGRKLAAELLKRV